MTEEIENGRPPRSPGLFHIKLHMFDDFIEMAQGGFQFVKAAFVEELHELSNLYLINVANGFGAGNRDGEVQD